MQPDLGYEMSARERHAVDEMCASLIAGHIQSIALLSRYLPSQQRRAISQRLSEEAAAMDGLRH